MAVNRSNYTSGVNNLSSPWEYNSTDEIFPWAYPTSTLPDRVWAPGAYPADIEVIRNTPNPQTVSNDGTVRTRDTGLEFITIKYSYRNIDEIQKNDIEQAYISAKGAKAAFKLPLVGKNGIAYWPYLGDDTRIKNKANDPYSYIQLRENHSAGDTVIRTKGWQPNLTTAIAPGGMIFGLPLRAGGLVGVEYSIDMGSNAAGYCDFVISRPIQANVDTNTRISVSPQFCVAACEESEVSFKMASMYDKPDGGGRLYNVDVSFTATHWRG